MRLTRRLVEHTLVNCIGDRVIDELAQYKTVCRWVGE